PFFVGFVCIIQCSRGPTPARCRCVARTLAPRGGRRRFFSARGAPPPLAAAASLAHSLLPAAAGASSVLAGPPPRSLPLRRSPTRSSRRPQALLQCSRGPTPARCRCVARRLAPRGGRRRFCVLQFTRRTARGRPSCAT